MAKINFKLRITRIFTCFDHKMVSVSIFTIIKIHFFYKIAIFSSIFRLFHLKGFVEFDMNCSVGIVLQLEIKFKTKQFFFASVETQKLIVQQKARYLIILCTTSELQYTAI
jgi:hypothetical protein